VRDALASDGSVFARSLPVKVVRSVEGGPPKAIPLTTDQIVFEMHRLRQPVRLGKNGTPVPTVVPTRVARMYLTMPDEWNLPPLAGICTAPLLASDGSVRTAQGYDRSTGLWCANVPALQIPERPTRADSEAALRRLRQTFQTFPFEDSVRRHDCRLGIDVVNLDLPPGRDESAFLAGLMTAICRPSLPLAPGFLVRAPGISGFGTGKGLLVRSICAIAFGIRPRAFTKGGDSKELEKRLSSALIEAEQVVFLDNVNSSILRSETLDSALTERPAGARILSRSRMATLNSTAFVAVTGNGLSVSEDSVRRFIVCELNAHCENPEQRRFKPGILANIEENRAELLGAALTIWRFGRQHAAEIERGRPIGSFEDWAEWCRDPLLALGCRDPIERIDRVKADDPHRRWVVELFGAWNAHHDELPIKAADLAVPVRALVDPRGRGRQHIETRLMQLVGTCAGGFTLTKQDAASGRDAYVFALRSIFGEGSESSAESRRPREEGAAVDGTAASARGHDEEVGLAPSQRAGLITIDVGGRSVYVHRDFDAPTLERVLEVLDRRR
jgi:putative DNA primase/helicase